MKKIFFLIAIIFTIATQSQVYTINSHLKLNTVSEGTTSDSVLVRGSDKIVRCLPISTIVSGNSTPTLQNVADAGNNSTTRLEVVNGPNTNIMSGGFSSVSDGTLTSSMTNSIINTNNGTGKFSQLSNTNGVQFNTSSNSAFAHLKSDNITTGRVFQFPDNSGTIATEDYIDSKNLDAVTTVGNFTNNKIQAKEFRSYGVSDSLFVANSRYMTLGDLGPDYSGNGYRYMSIFDPNWSGSDAYDFYSGNVGSNSYTEIFGSQENLSLQSSYDVTGTENNTVNVLLEPNIGWLRMYSGKYTNSFTDNAAITSTIKHNEWYTYYQDQSSPQQNFFLFKEGYVGLGDVENVSGYPSFELKNDGTGSIKVENEILIGGADTNLKITGGLGQNIALTSTNGVKFGQTGNFNSTTIKFDNTATFSNTLNLPLEDGTIATQEYVQNSTGWADYVGTAYTSVSPFSVTADTDTVLPNNAGTVIESQKPNDITTFYNGTTITGRNGDGISITVDFQAIPTDANATYIEVWFDITGGTGTPVNLANLYKRIITFPKGQGNVRPINFTVSGYTLGTWETNGAVVKVRSNGSVDLYDVRYVITRTHKAN